MQMRKPPHALEKMQRMQFSGRAVLLLLLFLFVTLLLLHECFVLEFMARARALFQKRDDKMMWWSLLVELFVHSKPFIVGNDNTYYIHTQTNKWKFTNRSNQLTNKLQSLIFGRQQKEMSTCTTNFQIDCYLTYFKSIRTE